MAAGLPAEPHVPLARYHLLYLGRAAPADVPDGLEAIQKPLIELLHQANVQGPLDSTLTVYTNGILAESSASGSDKWWPIQDLMECGAFKQSADGPLPFVPLMSLDGAAKSAPSNPTLFAMTFRRQDIPAANTWVFIAPSDDSAFTLVQAVTAAHENTAGWSSPNDRPLVAANAPSVQLSHTSNSSSQVRYGHRSLPSAVAVARGITSES
jgi:hypothetical protein